MDQLESLSHSVWECKYHVSFIVEDDYVRAAHNIMEWAGDEVPEPVAAIAYAGH